MKPTSDQIATAAKLACIDIYDAAVATLFDKLYTVGETVCGTKLVNGIIYVVNQGTRTIPGWIADATIMPIHHPVLGHLHSGFYQNLETLLKLLVADIAPMGNGITALLNTGHSKGGGEGDQLAGLLKLAGYTMCDPILFASPNAGFSDHADYMQQTFPDGLNFRNADEFDIGDPVPLVPAWPYLPSFHRTHIEVDPPMPDRLDVANWHHGPFYCSGALKYATAIQGAAK